MVASIPHIERKEGNNYGLRINLLGLFKAVCGTILGMIVTGYKDKALILSRVRVIHLA